MSKKSKLEIFKVQVPLGGTREDLALIYNKDRTIDFFSPITEEITLLMDNEPKAFVYGFMQDENFHVEKEAPWQDW